MSPFDDFLNFIAANWFVSTAVFDFIDVVPTESFNGFGVCPFLAVFGVIVVVRLARLADVAGVAGPAVSRAA